MKTRKMKVPAATQLSEPEIIFEDCDVDDMFT